MTALVVQGDARQLPLPDASVDLIVTSPPYFGLRSYTDGGEHYAGQIGSETTPTEFVDALIDCTREWMRVLKPSGSIFVNLGDKYDSGTTAARKNPGTVKDGTGQGWHQGTPRWTGGRRKSLVGLPWRYALRCIDDLGLILRAEIIWSKPNGLPESVTDRAGRSHEQWFHFTVNERYYSAVDELREPHLDTSPHAQSRGERHSEYKTARLGAHTLTSTMHPLGKLPGSVWEVPSQPLVVPAQLGVDHFAAFPTEWPRRLILGWSPAAICVGCGEGRRPVTAVEQTAWGTSSATGRPKLQTLHDQGGHGHGAAGYPKTTRSTSIVGYACACVAPDAPTLPAVVLDPFGGTGTTALVASTLGRIGVTVDRSLDYCRLAQWRTTDPGERARAMRVPKPPKQASGQLDLLTATAEEAG